MRSTFLLAAGVIVGFVSCGTQPSLEKDLAAFKKLRADLGQAFIDGDINTVTAYHHPDVVKAVAYGNLLRGREANLAGLGDTFKAYSMKFAEHNIESFEIHGGTATEISTFTIEGTPRDSSHSAFEFRGRSMVLYIRYKESPAGWALIREMIQKEE